MSTPSNQILISKYSPKNPGLLGEMAVANAGQGKYQINSAPKVRMYANNDEDMLKGQLEGGSQGPNLEQFEQQNNDRMDG